MDKSEGRGLKPWTPRFNSHQIPFSSIYTKIIIIKMEHNIENEILFKFSKHRCVGFFVSTN